MFRAKLQGVELSMNAIIIMALGLLILAIGAYLILGSTGKFGDATGCVTHGGQCFANSCPSNYPISSPFSCTDKAKPKCCMNVSDID
jgi:hypothetical protein